jgi:DNA polymerase-3 subunit beta
MRLSCLQENLSRGLAVVGRAVATRTTLPITQNVLVSTDQSRLKLVATNTEISITTWIGAQIEDEGSITLPARLLTELVNSLPPERIDIAETSQETGITISCARFNASMNGIDADEFPPIPTVESGMGVKIDPNVLSDAIKHVAFAAATEDSRPVLTGIKVEISGDGFTFAAADGFRLAVYEGKLVEALSEDASFIVPSRALQEVNRLIAGQQEPIELTVTPTQSAALFKLDNIEVVTQLLQGAFPNYSQLIPGSYDTRALVDLEEFARATKSASIFARDGSGIIKINVSGGGEGDPGSISVESEAAELGKNVGKIDAKVDGEEAKIAFNSKYLSDVLEILEVTEVALETTTPSSPGVIRPIGNDNYVHVVMPMFVQW